MAISVKKIAMWRREVENKPGALDAVLAPLAEVGSDLQLVMGYGYTGDAGKAAIEVFPVKGKKAMDAAKDAGLVASSIAGLLVEGDNKPGLGHNIATSIAGAGINIGFLVAQVLGRKFTAVFGFHSESDASKATGLIKKAAAIKKSAARKPATKAPMTKMPAAKKPAAKKPAAKKPAAKKGAKK